MKTRIAWLLASLMLWPATAHAAFGWLDWLDNLSGPGPSIGGGYGFVARCIYEGLKLERCDSTRAADERKGTAEVGASVLLTWGTRRFPNDRDDRQVGIVIVDGMVHRQVPKLPTWIELGAGGGYAAIAGGGFNPLFRPIVSYGALLRTGIPVDVEVSITTFVGDLSPAKFGAGGLLDTGDAEFVWRFRFRFPAR